LFLDKNFKENIQIFLLVLAAFMLGIGISQTIKSYFMENQKIYIQMIVFLIIPIISSSIISYRSHRKIFISVFLAAFLGGIPTLTIIPLVFLFYMAGGETPSKSLLEFLSRNIDLVNYYSLNNILIILFLTTLSVSIYGFFMLILFRVVSSWDNVEKIRYPLISIITFNEYNDNKNKKNLLLKMISAALGILLAFLSSKYGYNNLFIDLWTLLVPISVSFSILFFYIFKYSSLFTIGRLVFIDKDILLNSYSLGAELALFIFILIILPLWEKLKHYFEEIDMEYVLPFGIIFILLLLISFLFFEFNAIYIFFFLSLISLISAFLISRIEGQYMFPLTYSISDNIPISYSDSSIYLLNLISSSYTIVVNFPGLIYGFLVFNPAIYIGSSYSLIINKTMDKKTNILIYSILGFFFSLLTNYLLDITKVNNYLVYSSIIKEKSDKILSMRFDPIYSIIFMSVFLLLGFLDITLMQVQSFPSFLNIGSAFFVNIVKLGLIDFLIIFLISFTKYLFLRKRKNIRDLREFSKNLLFSYSISYLFFISINILI